MCCFRTPCLCGLRQFFFFFFFFCTFSFHTVKQKVSWDFPHFLSHITWKVVIFLFTFLWGSHICLPARIFNCTCPCPMGGQGKGGSSYNSHFPDVEPWVFRWTFYPSISPHLKILGAKMTFVDSRMGTTEDCGSCADNVLLFVLPQRK